MPLVGKRYAEALVDVSLENGETDNYRSKLKTLVDLYKNQAEFKWLLSTPEVSSGIKKETLTKSLGAEPGDRLVNFLMLLIDKGRIDFLPEIFKEYEVLADKRKNILNIVIVSASALDESQIERIKEKYAKEYNASSVNAKIELDNSLLGGVKIKIGDRVIDGSVRGRLEALRQLTMDN